jgi:hypothetical protein
MVKGEMGRKPGPAKDRRDERITVPLNVAELAQINAAVEASGLPAATYCRLTLLRATARDSKKK